MRTFDPRHATAKTNANDEMLNSCMAFKHHHMGARIAVNAATLEHIPSYLLCIRMLSSQTFLHRIVPRYDPTSQETGGKTCKDQRLIYGNFCVSSMLPEE